MTRLTRRSILAAAALAPFAGGSARAQQWPSGTVRIVNPFPAGGSSDGITRAIQPGLQQRLGVPVIIENKPGASATIGAAMVAKSPPDGSTWLITSDTFVNSPLLLSSVPFDVQKDFEPVALIARGPMVLCSHPSRPYKTLSELIAAAQEKPESISYATSGTGGLGHLTTVLLSQRTGAKLVHVPYRGIGPAVNDAVAGHVDMVISSSASLAQQIEAGKLHPIVQCGATRAEFLPNTPTVIESGIAGFETYSWFGVFAPAGTPAAIVNRFYADLAATVRDEVTTRSLIRIFQVELPLLNPAELRILVERQLAMWGAVIRDNNIKGAS